ncbi:MAG: choice-of-anchor Q domain-containing protein [bacterium]
MKKSSLSARHVSLFLVPFIILLIAFSEHSQVADAQPGPPRLFFSDIESGPNTGGQGNLGAFITLYGEGFGATRGSSTITMGGQQVVNYVAWGENNAFARDLDMIVVQPGAAVTTGSILVTVNAQTSNPLPFAVRPGNIYFVATNGDDLNNGSFATPWRTVVNAKNSLAPGDIVYVMDGVVETVEDMYGAALSIETSGAPGAPKAIIAYPGAVATIGSTALEFGTRVPNNPDTLANDWVMAKLVLRGLIQALDIGGSGSSRWRVVGNDISCPLGDGPVGCFAAALASHVAFLGNEVHDVSAQGPQPSKQYHAVYFTTDSNHIEVGWNHIHDNMTCRALQFHSSPLCVPDCGTSDTTGFNQYDLIVHDNLIHGDVCDGIVFATVDPSKGPVRAYNNIIYDVGRGPSPPDGDANYTGIYVAGGTNTGADGTGVVEIFNNTLYDCGRAQGVPSDNTDKGVLARGPGSPNLIMDLRDNLVYAVSGETYFSPSSDTSLTTGTHNLWFGGGAAPDFLTGNISGDPLMVNVASGDFRLTANSPAVNGGVTTGAAWDYLGTGRPQGASFDIGAYEFVSSEPPGAPDIWLFH